MTTLVAALLLRDRSHDRRRAGRPDRAGAWASEPRLSGRALSVDERCALIDAPFLELYSTVKRHEADKCRGACHDYDEPSFHSRIDPIELAWYGDVI